MTKNVGGKIAPPLPKGLLPPRLLNQNFEIVILFNIVQRYNIYGFGDDMTLHDPWGKDRTLHRYQAYRYQAYRYGRIGIAGMLNRFLIAHIKDIAHIYVLPINSTISKFQMALKTPLLVSLFQVDKARAIRGLPELFRVIFNG